MQVTRRTRDMSQNDELAKERIDVLESQLLAADIETDEWRQKYHDLKVEYERMIADRTFCP